MGKTIRSKNGCKIEKTRLLKNDFLSVVVKGNTFFVLLENVKKHSNEKNYTFTHCYFFLY